MFTNSAGANNAGIFLIKHIERNPRFDCKQHWAGIGDIGQTYGILGTLQPVQILGIFLCMEFLIDLLTYPY